MAGGRFCEDEFVTREAVTAERPKTHAPPALGRLHDPVNHPRHYTNHPSGVECIQITRHMGFNLGNVMKYIWRADLKNGVEDLEKALWYLQDELAKRRLSK